MHSFLRSVGFSAVRSRTELEKILGIVMTSPDHQVLSQSPFDPTRQLCEKSKDFSERMGITVIGEYDEKNFFHINYYFPYLRGKQANSVENVAINHRIDSDAYTGMCDDYRLGLSLIFYLQNGLDYIRCMEAFNSDMEEHPITLTGLASDGMVLLPISKNKEQLKATLAENSRHNKLIKAAHDGDQNAINNLTLKDIDTFAMINRRLKNEDIYSIVETTFFPCGSESDNYTILGTISEVNHRTNSMSGENITELLVISNGLAFYVCINDSDLIGEPRLGRRFKGNIWLQGSVDFAPYS